MKLIVYGTLMRGESNHYMMKLCGMEGAEYLGDVTVPNAVLYDLGGYPGLKFLPMTRPLYNLDEVHGELYEVSEKHIKELDRFEGVPTLYDRIECEYEIHGDWITHLEGHAYIYEYQRDTYEPHMPGGDWKKRHTLP
jgi:gamma-glutamylcyclotransferase (GGCT)/AIG2-like uncharacterized protein YtfP